MALAGVDLDVVALAVDRQPQAAAQALHAAAPGGGQAHDPVAALERGMERLDGAGVFFQLIFLNFGGPLGTL